MTAARPGGDAVDDLDLDAGVAQVLDLLAAAAEDERVAALQAHHVFAFRAAVTISRSMKACGVLLQPPRLPTCTMRCGGRASAAQDLVADEVVDQQHGRGLDRLHRLQGQQFRVAGAGADEAAARSHHAPVSGARGSNAADPAQGLDLPRQRRRHGKGALEHLPDVACRGRRIVLVRQRRQLAQHAFLRRARQVCARGAVQVDIEPRRAARIGEGLALGAAQQQRVQPALAHELRGQSNTEMLRCT